MHDVSRQLVVFVLSIHQSITYLLYDDGWGNPRSVGGTGRGAGSDNN